MSVDLSDPNISRTYDDIIKNKGKDWLLLTYGKTRDRLTLLSSGIGSFDTLCEAVPHEVEDVYFGFCRERDGESNYFAMISFVPDGVSGVRRARALVHSRAVGTLFKTANVSMTVSDLQAQTVEKLRERLQLGPTLIPRLAPDGGRAVQRSVSMPVNTSSPQTTPLPSRFVSIKSKTTTPFQAQSQSQHQPKYSGLPSIPSEYSDDGASSAPPPPLPAKEQRVSSGYTETAMTRSVSSAPDMSRRRAVTVYSENEGDEVVIKPSRSSGIHPGITPRVVSPEQKARQRLEAQRRRIQEEALALREEEERQAKLKRQKEAALAQAAKEEELRRVRLEEEKRHALAERARRVREEEMEEEHRQQELETRRRQERERRMLYARRMEEEKLENEMRAMEAAKRREEQRRASNQVKHQRMSEIQTRFARFGVMDANVVMHSGSVSVQTSGSVSWKRRHFELTGTAISFYRDSQDNSAPLDLLMLNDGRIAAISEADEGHEELEAIPHAFAVEFNDGEDAWAMFCDNAEDKDILMSLLSKVAGL